MRGAQYGVEDFDKELGGPSPHARGAVASRRAAECVRGAIPACTGRSLRLGSVGTQFVGHPRMHGAQVLPGREVCVGGGPSPHARGADFMTCSLTRGKQPFFQLPENGYFPFLSRQSLNSSYRRPGLSHQSDRAQLPSCNAGKPHATARTLQRTPAQPVDISAATAQLRRLCVVHKPDLPAQNAQEVPVSGRVGLRRQARAKVLTRQGEPAPIGHAARLRLGSPQVPVPQWHTRGVQPWEAQDRSLRRCAASADRRGRRSA